MKTLLTLAILCNMLIFPSLPIEDNELFKALVMTYNILSLFILFCILILI